MARPSASPGSRSVRGKLRTLPLVIPERAHAETSFGFLIAIEQGADFVVELDETSSSAASSQGTGRASSRRVA
jgi:hypothetical protein